MSEWRDEAELNFPRSEIFAAVFDKKIYVAGGIGFFRTLSSCEAFDLVSRAWRKCPNLPEPTHHVGLAATENALWAAVGYSCLRFTHQTDPKLLKLSSGAAKWTKVTSLPKPIGEHSLLHHRGKLYIVGGRTASADSAELHEFDVETSVWRELKPMPTARHSFGATIHNNEIWVIGGRSSKLGSRIDIVEIYDIENGAWRISTPIPNGGGGISAISFNGQVHVLGGEVFEPSMVLDRHHAFDADKDIWTSLPPAPDPRHGLASVAFEDKIYSIGGGAKPGLRTVYSVTGKLQVWHK